MFSVTPWRLVFPSPHPNRSPWVCAYRVGVPWLTLFALPSFPDATPRLHLLAPREDQQPLRTNTGRRVVPPLVHHRLYPWFTAGCIPGSPPTVPPGSLIPARLSQTPPCRPLQLRYPQVTVTHVTSNLTAWGCLGHIPNAFPSTNSDDKPDGMGNPRNALPTPFRNAIFTSSQAP